MNRIRIMMTMALVSVTAGLAPVTHSAQYSAEIRAGVGVSDNTGRTAQDEFSDTILTYGLSFGITEETNRSQIELNSRFDYFDYQDNNFSAEWIGGLNGAATFTLIDERLRWLIEDTFGQRTFDPFRPARPGNREDLNFFTTGPTLSLLPAGRNHVDLDIRYSSVDYEIQDLDNTRGLAALRIGRDTSRNANLSLNASVENIEYDDDSLVPDFDRRSAYIRYTVTGNRSSIGFDLGYNEIESDLRSSDGLLARLDWTRQTSARGILSVTAGTQFSDQGNLFRLTQGLAPSLEDTAALVGAAGPFVSNFLSVVYRLEQERHTIGVTLEGSQEDYDGQGLDRDSYRGDLELRRNLSRKLSAGARVGFQRQEFKGVGQRDNDVILRADIGYEITPGFSVSVEYSFFTRNSTGDGSDYDENRAFLRFIYIPLWSR